MARSFVHLALVCIAFLTKSSSSLENGSIYRRYHPSIQKTQNLKQILEFIHESPEFRPPRMSIILPEFRSSIVDVVLNYIGQRETEVYKIRARDLTWKFTSIDKTRLTWTIFVRDLYTLNIFVHWQPKLWRSCNQYLIFFSGSEVKISWNDIFKNLWQKYGVYRAVIVPIQDDFNCLFRYAPFEIHDDDFGGVHKLCSKKSPSERSKNVLFLDKNTRLFENFYNLNSYPLNVVAFESLLMGVAYDDKKRLKLSKMDSQVLYALEGSMRSKFHVKARRAIDFGLASDPFDQSLKEIESGRAEMVATGFFVKFYTQHHHFRFTSALYEDKVCFLAPDSGLVPKAYMPFMPFEKDLWALLAVYNVGIVLLWCLMNYANRSLQRRPIHSSTTRRSSTRRPGSLKDSPLEPPEVPGYLLTLFRFFELFCYPLQIGDTPAQKALLVGALFFGLIINGVYQSCLVSSFNKPFHYSQLHTLEDVLDSGKMLFTKYANLKSVFLDDIPLDRMLEQRIHVVNNTKSTKGMVAFENMIAVSRYFSMVLGDYAYYDEEGNPLLHVVDECPMNYRVSYVLRSNSPYEERVNFVLDRLKEAGLLTFWFDNMTYPLKIVKMKKLRQNDRTIQLTLEHYSLAFLLLFVGLLGSAIMFLVEVYTARRAKRKTR
ncbi:uncharacterized protein LOC143350184 [Colletes latitarsis]|uniref:uncharacterized protein LOC143350184 n=1 Tax=Colletes latitarsis TaxID=2605962 RepID=UPI00403682CD